VIAFGLLRSSLPVDPPSRGVILKEVPFADPYRTYLAIRGRFSPSFLLESAPGPKRLAEYTFIGFAPRHVAALKGGRLFLDGVDVGPALDPLSFLRELLAPYRTTSGEFKYLGGLVGYISYDFVGYLERLPERPDPEFPVFLLGLYLDGLIFDHKKGRCFYFTFGDDRAEEVLAAGGDAPAGDFSLRSLGTDTPKARFLTQVERAKEYIRAGHIYQVVLSRRVLARFRGDLITVYGRLRDLNPSPYMYFLDFGDVKVAGSSPEMFLAVKGDRLFTCPIAGTRPVTGDPTRDEAYREELLSDEKELAEHNMLVDLARNDIGRVARFGSVRVSEYLKVERFSHVQHLVSLVEGRLSEGKDALDAFAALFPAGTVSGAPKVRAMEIIAELEESPRGPYAGIVGYFSTNGNMDSAITIRTLFAKGRNLYLQAGAGIVADSVPEREWTETEKKLGALLAALELGVAP
jgi:anthranilate synthase component 1